jgi:hypothetical protein
MSQSANSSDPSAVAISHRTVGISFDLPPLKLDNLQCVGIDAQPVIDHIEDVLPKLVLPPKNASFDWLSNDRSSSPNVNRYPQLENTPQYLRCRRALNDLQVTLDQGPLGSCLDLQRNRLVVVGAAACIGNMFCFIVPPRLLDPSDKQSDFGAPMLRPRQTSATGSVLTWQLNRSSGQLQAAVGAVPIFVALAEQLSPQAERLLGPPAFPMPGSSSQSPVPPPSINPIAAPPDISSLLKPPMRTWFPDLTAGLQFKLTSLFQVATQVSGNPVKGAASLGIKPSWTPSTGWLRSFDLSASLNFISAGQQTQVGASGAFSVELRDLKVGPIHLNDFNAGAGLQISPGLKGLKPSIGGGGSMGFKF